MKKLSFLFIILLTLVIGGSIGVGLSYFVFKNQYKRNAVIAKNPAVNSTQEILTNGLKVGPSKASSTASTQSSLQITNSETGIVTKECFGINFAYDSSKLQIGYVDTGKTVGVSDKSEFSKAIKNSQDGKCTKVENQEKLIYTLNGEQGGPITQLLAIFPKGTGVGCVGCDFPPTYIKLTTANLSTETQFVSGSKKINTISVEDYNNQSVGQIIPRKAKVAFFEKNGIKYELVLDLDRLSSFNKTEVEALSDFESIVSSINL
jgi:hypothetical protein